MPRTHNRDEDNLSACERIHQHYGELLLSRRTAGAWPVPLALELAELSTQMAALLDEEAEHHRRMARRWRDTANNQ